MLALVALVGRASANPYNVSEVPKMIDGGTATKLHALGIHMTDQLLVRAVTVDDRQSLAKSIGLPAPRVERMARHADLLRLMNIGPEFVILLEATGVRSIPDLATRDAATLTKKTAAVNRKRHIAKPGPTEAQLRDWITQSAKLPAVLVPG
jgi:hypothetical protein